MIELFKNYMLNIFILFAFFLSQVINVNANHLKNYPEIESFSVSVIEPEKKKTNNIATLLYVPNFTDTGQNKAALEGKVEKVFEPITLGVFSMIGALGFGFLTGSIMATFTAIIGWAIGKTKSK